MLVARRAAHLLHALRRHLPAYAEGCGVGTRRNYNERRKALYETTERVRREVVHEMEPSNPQKIHVIDSMPIESCRFARAKNSRVFREHFGSNPDYGFCASHKANYFGYKFHTVCTPGGVVEHFELTPANVADISMLPEIRERFSYCVVLGDKGYLNRDVAMELFEYAGIELVVPYRSNMREQPVLPMGFGRTRKRVEVLFSQLAAQGGLRRSCLNSAFTFDSVPILPTREVTSQASQVTTDNSSVAEASTEQSDNVVQAKEVAVKSTAGGDRRNCARNPVEDAAKETN